MNIGKQFLTEKETAKITGRGLSTLRNERSKGVGIPYCKISRSIRYQLKDVMEWMEARKVITR